MPVRTWASLLPLAAVALVLVSGPAAARPRHAALLERGRKALSARDFPAAYRALALAYEKNPGPEGLYHLGLLAAAEGRTVEAQDLMRRYLEEAEGEDPAARSEAQRIVSGARLACGEVSVLGERRALVYLDRRLVGTLPLALPLLVSAGAHHIAVQTGGKRLESPIDVPVSRTVEMRFDARAGAVVTTVPPAVLLVERFRNLPAEAAERIARANERAVRGAHLAPLPPDVVRELGPGLTGCLEAGACAEWIRRRADVEWVLVTEVEMGTGATVSAHLLDTETGEEAAGRRRSCPGCSPEAVGEAVASLVGEVLKQGTARGRGTLQVDSDPPAEIAVGTQPLGRTPLRRAMLEGPVEVHLTQTGYRPERRTVVIRDRETTSLQVKLEMDPPEPAPAPLMTAAVQPPPPRRVLRTVRAARPRWRIALGLSALGAGLGLGGLGVSALAVDGACVAEPTPPAVVCRQVYNTTAAGAGLLAASGVLLVGGGGLVALPGPRQTVEARITALPLGAGLALGGRF